MARKKSSVLTDAEQRIMRVLWSKGEASVHDVTNILSQERQTAYNTVLTMLRILTDKGYVEPRREGRAFIYTPIVSRADARTQALSHVLSQFFEGSPTVLAAHLIDHVDIDAEELDALRRELDRAPPREGSGDG
ncbi:MAG: BlaI/MecI/CopY family transcriptional regulator [Maricaulaceae bacterium]|jgi:predicted transcriptional regulator